MASPRELRRKIKSVRSTCQITRAMELVSAAKMKKATSAATKMRVYASTALMILTQIAEKTEEKTHPLLKKRPVKKILAVAFSSDRGLCGGFNSLLFKKILEFEKNISREEVTVDYVAVGKRVGDFLARGKRNILLSFPSASTNPKLSDTLPIGRFVLSSYTDGTYDKIVLIYPHFISPLVQKPTIYQLLPFSRKVLMEMGASLNLFKHLGAEIEEAPEYLFEPSPMAILENLLPQLTQMQIYQAALEESASEHSARMVAMRSATDNATDFIQDLTLNLNQVRQAGITREIAEISAGKIALEF